MVNEIFRIAGVKVKTPSLPLKFGEFDVTNRRRVASAKMVGDIIATKRRVDVFWKMIEDSELELILNTIRANKPYFTIEFPVPGGQQTITCYNGDIYTSLWHTTNGVRYWDKVTISFIEQ